MMAEFLCRQCHRCRVCFDHGGNKFQECLDTVRVRSNVCVPPSVSVVAPGEYDSAVSPLFDILVAVRVGDSVSDYG